MDKYSESKIYVIKFKDNENLFYIGSTTKTLEEQMNEHKNKYNCLLAHYILLNYNGNWDNCYIELCENCSCYNRKELKEKEYEFICLYKNNRNYRIINCDEIFKEQKLKNHKIIEKYMVEKAQQKRDDKIAQHREIQKQKEQLYIEYSNKIKVIEELIYNSPYELINKYNKEKIKIIRDYNAAFRQLSHSRDGINEQ